MAFEFVTSTDEIREKMFNFIKPVFKTSYDFDVKYINWTNGVYDSESGIFITYVNSKSDRTKYIVLSQNDSIFYVIVNAYRHEITEIPSELSEYADIIKSGIVFYNNKSEQKKFKDSFQEVQHKLFDEITENMWDRCRPSFEINCYEDAENFFIQKNYSDYYIKSLYNKKTVSQFCKFMSKERVDEIRGEEYVRLLNKICNYKTPLSEEDYKNISYDFSNTGIISYGVNDIYPELTLSAVKKGFYGNVISVGFSGFIENYIKTCIKLYPEKLNELRPLLDFINENMQDNENFGRLNFHKKQLEKRIFGETQGFDFVITSDEIQEKMFDFLKPEYRGVNDLNCININWVTGVYDKESGIFLTQIYYVPDGIARCGINYNSYLVITDKGDIFRVDNNDIFEKHTYEFNIPEEYTSLTAKVKEAIEYYQCSYEFRSYLSDEQLERNKKIRAEMNERCHRNYSINSEEDAKKLLEIHNFSAGYIRGIYNKKTIEKFDEYATDENIIFWRGNKYLQLLEEVSDGFLDISEKAKKFYEACRLFRCGVNETYDEQFLKAAKSVYTKKFGNQNELASYIEVYINEYPEKVNSLIPLIEFADSIANEQVLKLALKNAKKMM